MQSECRSPLTDDAIINLPVEADREYCKEVSAMTGSNVFGIADLLVERSVDAMSILDKWETFQMSASILLNVPCRARQSQILKSIKRNII